MSQKKSKEVRDLTESVLKQYKFELQGKKYYNLVTNKIKLDNVFGSLSCLDYDIDNMNVNSDFCLQLSF